MSFDVRFDKSCKIREFIQFLECESETSGQELYLEIANVIRNFGLEISTFRGQGAVELVIWQRKKMVYHAEF